MSDDQGLGHEKGNDRENPEDNVGGAGLNCGSHVVGDDDDQELSENQVEEAEFLAESGAVRLNFCFDCLECRVVRGGQG